MYLLCMQIFVDVFISFSTCLSLFSFFTLLHLNFFYRVPLFSLTSNHLFFCRWSTFLSLSIILNFLVHLFSFLLHLFHSLILHFFFKFLFLFFILSIYFFTSSSVFCPFLCSSSLLSFCLFSLLICLLLSFLSVIALFLHSSLSRSLSGCQISVSLNFPHSC